jgi:hypothetical protein
MSFDLAVWHGNTALSVEEAGDLYRRLCNQEWAPAEWHPGVDAFYIELCSRYPEIDMLADDEVDNCPWSCGHDRSGQHVIMCLTYGNQLRDAALFITRLAAKHGLICFDPQEPVVYLPPGLKLKPKRSLLSFW